MSSINFTLTEIRRESEQSSTADKMLTPLLWAAGGKSYKISKGSDLVEKITRVDDTKDVWKKAAKRIVGVLGTIVLFIPVLIGLYIKNSDENAKKNYEALNKHLVNGKIVVLDLNKFHPKILNEPTNVFYGWGSGDQPFYDMSVLANKDLWNKAGLKDQEQMRQELMGKFEMLGKGRTHGDGIWEETKDLRNYILAIKELLSKGDLSTGLQSELLGLCKDLEPLKDGKDPQGVCLKAVKERYESLLDGADHQAQKRLRALNTVMEDVLKVAFIKMGEDFVTLKSEDAVIAKAKSTEKVIATIMKESQGTFASHFDKEMQQDLEELERMSEPLTPEELVEKTKIINNFNEQTVPIRLMERLKKDRSLGSEEEIFRTLQERQIFQIVD